MKPYDLQELSKYAGGDFRLTVLVQKRMKELNSGAKRLVEIDSNDLMEIVYHEILENKIKLVADDDGGGSAIEQTNEDSVRDLLGVSPSSRSIKD